MNTAIIHFEPVFSKRDQGIFFKKTLKKIKREIQIENHSVLLYLLPVSFVNPSEKAVMKFIAYLKEEKIEKLLLSDSVKKRPEAEILKKHFQIYEGNTIINYKIHDILKKCSQKKDFALEDSTLVLYSNQPEWAKEFLLKVYPLVKEIHIQTKVPEQFSQIILYFLQDYGIYIAMNEKNDEKEIVVVSDEDFQGVVGDLYLNCEEQTKVLFQKKFMLEDFEKIVEPNQKMIEFLVENIYDNLKNENIQQFFTKYPVRITKIKNND